MEERHRAERETLDRERQARTQREADTRDRAERAERAEREARERAATEAAANQAAALAAAALTPPPVVAAAPAPLLTPEPAPAEAVSLDFNAEAKAAFDSDLNFAPAPPATTDEARRKAEVDELLAATAPSSNIPLSGSGPDTFADTGTEPDTFSGESAGEGKAQELASRKEIEREAKDRAKADAKAKKEAEREAKRLAKQGQLKGRRGGPSAAVMAGGAIAFAVIGGVAYLFMMPIDKAAIERTLSERLGEPVTIGAAKFSPFPPALTLSKIAIGPVTLNSVVANPDAASLLSDNKIWKTVEVNGLALTVDTARHLIALGRRDVSKIAAGKTEIQRVRISDAEISGLPVPMQKFKADIALGSAGVLKQITLASVDDKARVVLAPDEKGWSIDLESRATTWPLGPKVAWESLRAKGTATTNGIKFDEYSITQFSSSGRGTGELSWNAGWKFTGTLDVGGMESEAIAQALYGAAPVSGTLEGKVTISMTAPTLPRLFDAPQIDGPLNVNKAVIKNMDLARATQTGAAVSGATRFSDFSVTLAVAGGKLQLKDIKGVSGLLTVSGGAEVNADKTLGGTLTVELGVGGSRAKATPKLSGTVAEPKIAK